MKDFARYVILSPATAIAAPASAHVISSNRSDNPFRLSGGFDKATNGFDGRPLPSKGEPLGAAVTQPHIDP